MKQLSIAHVTYERLRSISWLRQVGAPCPTISIPCASISTAEEALAHALSTAWTDIGTEAQGDLTEYLSRCDYELYGCNWIRLANDSRAVLDEVVAPDMSAAFRDQSLHDAYERAFLDVWRIVLHSAFSAHMRGLPQFFHQLLLVYEAGHLPCGWRGRLKHWPQGTLLVY